jgi:hypothetical protein
MLENALEATACHPPAMLGKGGRLELTGMAD